MFKVVRSLSKLLRTLWKMPPIIDVVKGHLGFMGRWVWVVDTQRMRSSKKPKLCSSMKQQQRRLEWWRAQTHVYEVHAFVCTFFTIFYNFFFLLVVWKGRASMHLFLWMFLNLSFFIVDNVVMWFPPHVKGCEGSNGNFQLSIAQWNI